MASHVKDIKPLPHHAKRSICSSRPTYREGRRATAVKVYTIIQESCYLLITNVAAVGANEELRDACLEYGDISDFYPADGYETEQFTEAYIVRYARIQSSRVAKKKLDEKSFFGSQLHVCYAPEFESVEETRDKLLDRQRYIAYKTGQPFKSSLQRRKRCAEQASPQAVGTSFPNQDHAVLQQVQSIPGFNPLFNDEPLSFKKPEQTEPQEVTSSSTAPKRHASELAHQSFERTVSVIRDTIKNVYASNSPAQPDNMLPSSADTGGVSSDTETDEYSRTMSAIRDRMKTVAVPNVDVLLRKRKP
ncbi:RNA-binding protein 48-like [Ornithodoros turicata]|uniref:RNA-binding protein 48-like n=1 Tax=Ornithodoros turicata TaxID=34597 RepID=UPI00313A3F84